MNAAFLSFLTNAIDNGSFFIAIVDGSGNETSSARIAAPWHLTGTAGQIRFSDEPIVFSGTPGDPAVGWRLFSALTGGTAYDGGNFFVPGQFSAGGEFTLTPSNGINISVAVN